MTCCEASVVHQLSLHTQIMAKAELRYETRQALEEFLSTLDADYGQYAQELFQKGVRKRSQIASDTILTDCGVLPFHVGDLKVKCNPGRSIWAPKIISCWLAQQCCVGLPSLFGHWSILEWASNAFCCQISVCFRPQGPHNDN